MREWRRAGHLPKINVELVEPVAPSEEWVGAVEPVSRQLRVRAPGRFPTEQAALKCLNLVTRSLDPTGTGRARWAMRWKPVLDAFAITFGDRWPAAETY